ncbi:AAA family ATPase [Peterkaempfera bronchialis]|uniref:ATPase n=1 Tax=Peterkaempfera bronchialis TaxID=2126346 RepID=A0A345SZ74_9ACTN|nr:AAA family ATPase [Peterkaempfera bronchialis]AXI79029.1 ATPase [Peterkaempfera bronchialis]
MQKRLLALEVENFRSLRRIHVPLGPLTVLVGPNGAGKTNVLEVFTFLADVIGTDLLPALDARGGFGEVVFRGGSKAPASVRIRLKACWTSHSKLTAPDEYEITITNRTSSATGVQTLSRREEFAFKRVQGRGRRIHISGVRAEVQDVDAAQEVVSDTAIGIQKLSSGLSTLPRLSDDSGGTEVAAFAERLASFRVFDIDVSAARRPSRITPSRRRGEGLADDASNLAGFLLSLSRRDPGTWERLVEDAIAVLPQLEGIDFEFPSGAAREVVVVLRERGLRRPTELADASYGTIRLLSLLALLYDPNPPALTCIEEIDHGLHPQALELLVQRLREASERTQLLIATHSPALVDRLEPHEFIICERTDDGASAIPALTEGDVRRIQQASQGRPLGELWFSGALGGDL